MAFWRRLFSGGATGAGNRHEGLQQGVPSSYAAAPSVPVTTDTAMSVSAVWACVKLYAETIGSLPVNVYEKDPATGVRKLVAPDHHLAILFNGKMNGWQTRQEFFETLTYQLALLGNTYALKQYGTKGKIVGLIPLMADQMKVALNAENNVVYQYSNGKTETTYSPDKIWHNKLFGNGIVGLSPLGFARNAIAIGSAAETATSKIYANGGKRSGALSTDKILTPDQRQKVKNNFNDLTTGDGDRLLVLEAGMKFEAVSMSPQDIEMLSSRRFQIEDIARFFGVPSVLINDTSTTTAWGSGIQQIVEGWYKLGLRPYLERYQDSMKVALLTPEERMTTDIEFDLSELLQPSFADRVKTYKEAVTGGIMSPNEARLREGMALAEGGDEIFMQQQLWPIKKLASPERSLDAPTAPNSTPESGVAE